MLSVTRSEYPPQIVLRRHQRRTDRSIPLGLSVPVAGSITPFQVDAYRRNGSRFDGQILDTEYINFANARWTLKAYEIAFARLDQGTCQR